VVADESIGSEEGFRRVVKDRSFDGVHLKLEKAGSISGLFHQVRSAADAGLDVYLGQMDQGRLGSCVTAHLAACVDARAYEVWGFQQVEEDIATGFEVEQGCARLPEGAGTGVNVDWDRLRLIAEVG